MKTNSTDEIVSGLFSAFTRFKQRLSFKAPLYQLPMAQMETLRLISEKKQVHMKEIADFLAITPPSATVLINHLAKEGFVQRGSSSNDRRAVHLKLTKQGEQVLEKGIKERCKDLKKLLTNLSHKEQAEFLRILKKMVLEK